MVMEAEKRIDFRKEDLKRVFEEYKKEKKNLLKKIEEKFSVLENIFITEETKGTKEFLEMKFKKASKSLNIYHREMVTDINLFTNRLNQIGVKENKKTFLDALEEGIQKRFEKVETMFAKSFLESDLVSRDIRGIKKETPSWIDDIDKQFSNEACTTTEEITPIKREDLERLKQWAKSRTIDASRPLDDLVKYIKEEAAAERLKESAEELLREEFKQEETFEELAKNLDKNKSCKVVELDFSKFCKELEEQANERSSAPIFREYINDKTLKPVNAAYIENSLGQAMFMVITNKGKIKYYSEEKFFKKFVEA